MDQSLIQTLLSTQDQAYKGALEIFMKQVSEKLETVQATVTELRTSLEFTQGEVQDLKHQVKGLEKEKKSSEAVVKTLNEDNQAQVKMIKDLEDRCNYQEDYSRRNNIQIVGLEEQQGETWEQTATQVSKLFEEKLQLPNLEIERAHRVGQRRDHQHRPVIARFSRFCDREAVLRNAAKLKGTRIFVNEDLCPASQNIRKSKIPMLKQARSDGKIAYFSHTKLIIKERLGTRTQRNNEAGPNTGLETGRSGAYAGADSVVTAAAVVGGASGVRSTAEPSTGLPKGNGCATPAAALSASPAAVVGGGAAGVVHSGTVADTARQMRSRKNK